MNWKAILNKTMGKELNQQLVQYFLVQSDELSDLVNHIKTESGKSADRATWVLNHIWDKYPHMVKPYITDLINHLKTEPSEAVQRNIIRILQDAEIPEESTGFLTDFCFERLLNPKSSIAVRAFSIPVLYKIAQQYPELQEELKLCLNEIIPNASSGLKNRSRNYLKKLNPR